MKLLKKEIEVELTVSYKTIVVNKAKIRDGNKIINETKSQTIFV